MRGKAFGARLVTCWPELAQLRGVAVCLTRRLAAEEENQGDGSLEAECRGAGRGGACLVACRPELAQQRGAERQGMGGLHSAAVQQRQGAALHRGGQPRRSRKRRQRVALYQQRAPLRLLYDAGHLSRPPVPQN